MSHAILAVDAGNTRVKFGVCCNDESGTTHLPKCEFSAALARDQSLPWDNIREQLSSEFGMQAIVTGSHPPTIERLLRGWPTDLQPLHVLSNRERLPIKLDVEFPDRVGIDRILTAIAANVLRTPDQPAIVVDTGTAVTVNALSSAGTFLGGAILPGVELAARALHQYTALLPELQLDEMLAHVPAPVGRHTEAAISSGLYWGHRGAVMELIDRMSCSLSNDEQSVRVILTGGASRLWTRELPSGWTYEPDLTLQGMAYAAMMVPDLFGPAA